MQKIKELLEKYNIEYSENDGYVELNTKDCIASDSDGEYEIQYRYTSINHKISFDKIESNLIRYKNFMASFKKMKDYFHNYNILYKGGIRDERAHITIYMHSVYLYSFYITETDKIIYDMMGNLNIGIEYMNDVTFSWFMGIFDLILKKDDLEKKIREKMKKIPSEETYEFNRKIEKICRK